MTSTMTRALTSKNHFYPRRFTHFIAVLTVLSLAVSAFGQAQDETTVAKFRSASRSMLNGRTYLVVSVEGPGGQVARVAIPNKGGNRVQYDPDTHLSDAVQDLKSGDLVEISVEMPRLGRPAMLRPKNSSATSIGFCCGSRHALGGAVSPGTVQPASNIAMRPIAGPGPTRVLRRSAPRNDNLFAVIASEAKQSR